jgi:capsular polysaccharide biosynthesis protein/Mrp family chromosome partitioning ATPase
MSTPELTPADRMSTYWATLRRRKRLLAALVATAVLAGIGVGLMAPQSYDATAKVLIGQRTQLDALLGASSYAPDPEREVNTSLELVSLEPVAENVRRRLGLDVDASTLIGKLSAQIDRNSNVVSITVRDRSPREAARLANAFAVGFREFAASSAQASIEDAVTAAKERAAGLAPGPERAALDAEVRRLEAAAAFKASGVQVVHPATGASATPTRNLAVNAIVAGFLGMVLAAVTVVVLARTDKRIHDDDELGAIVGAPVLAEVPQRLGPPWDTDGRDAFATLALSLALRGLPPRHQETGNSNGPSSLVLLLTSPGRRDDSATVTLGLAQALTEMGARVMAIEADLREPRLASELGGESTDGLVGILTKGYSLGSELIPFPWGSGAYIPAGAPPVGLGSPLPQTLLAGPELGMIVAEARRRADVVLIAGAPIGQVADSLALVPLVDAVLIVARLGATRADELERALAAFDELDAPVAGAVATSSRPRRHAGPRARPAVLRNEVAPPESVDATANGSARHSEVTR